MKLLRKKPPVENWKLVEQLPAVARLAASSEKINNRAPAVQAAKRVLAMFFCVFTNFKSPQFQRRQRDHRAQHAQDVEPHHDLRFIPAFFLKMMVQR